MGDLPKQDAHVVSLSGMSYALRWASAHKKILFSLAGASLAVVLVLSALIYGTQLKQVTIVADGKERQVVISGGLVQDVLEEGEIQVGEHDVVSLPLTAAVQDGDTIVIERAFPVRIVADGQTQEIYTAASNVESVLKVTATALGPWDKIEPGLNAQLAADDEIRITRVEKVLEAASVEIPYETVKQNDKSLVRGSEKVIQTGRKGLVTQQVEKVYEDGVLVSEQIVSEAVEQSSLNHIVAVGTKAPITNAVAVLSAETQEVTLGGMTFGVKDVLRNVTLTAYSAGFESTGKRKGDPGYGVTASGTIVSEGRTIAVDKDVIPMGWWVYIDGVGFRRAEDTGSAVKGKKIDLYFESGEYAQKFGTKRGYTVYVIGPKKPVAN